MVKEWGVSKDRSGFANCYEIECDGLDILDLNAPDYCILHWLGILLQNREFDIPSPLALESKEYLLANFAVDYKHRDVIIGYRADDSYFSFAQDFINGTISYRQLNNAMHLGKLGQQFVLKSQLAFDRIRFTDSEIAESNQWYAKKMLRDKTARREYFSVERNKRQRGDLYITQITDEEMKADDTPWFHCPPQNLDPLLSRCPALVAVKQTAFVPVFPFTQWHRMDEMFHLCRNWYYRLSPS